MKQNSSVPAFLSKLWTLVEDSDTNEFITWSQNGQSFLVLDEQRFAKEILPKYFKHNNMASFVRQLNMYGFRKVVHADSGVVKQERDGPVEFQHPFFVHGQDELLENIKRKVSSTRPEEAKVRQEDITKILSSAAKVQVKQDTIDSRLFSLKRENEALWREISDLRTKHNHQQQVIRKIVQFIVTLVQNNRLVSLKRKQPILLNTNSTPKSTLFQPLVKETGDDKHHVPHRNEGLKRGDLSEDIIIYDITDNMEDEGAEESKTRTEVTPETSDDNTSDSLNDRLSPEIVIVEDDSDNEDVPVVQENRLADVIGSLSPIGEDISSPMMSNALQLNSQTSLCSEDPVTMMDTILNESGVFTQNINQNINLLGKVELLDYLDSIDCTLDDFRALLSGRQFNVERDLLVDLENKGFESMKSSTAIPQPEGSNGHNQNSDQQLVQYTGFPLLALLDGDSGGLDTETQNDQLLDSNLDSEPTQSKLVRLEPLTEAEAQEATLFYLCELAPSPLDNDMQLLDQ